MMVRAHGRGRFVVAALAVAVLVAGSAVSGGPRAVASDAPAKPAHTPAPTTAQPASDGQLRLPEAYPGRVNYALGQGTDHWGEELLGLPDGASLRNVKPLLVPASHGGPTVADSSWSYLPLTYPAPDPAKWAEQRDFSLQVADGSELMSQWSDQRAAQRVTFQAGDELFGSAEARSRTPQLRDGYLPVLVNQYTDASGVRYERESFVTRLETGGPLVSMLRFTVSGSAPTAHLRVSVQTDGVERATDVDHQVTVDGKTILAYSGQARWTSPALDYDLDLRSGPASVYLVIANQPSAMPAVQPSRSLYERSRDQVSEYWRQLLRSGTRVDLPEAYAVDAMRSTLLNNLVMGFNLTVGNGYEGTDESFAFVPEVAATITSLGDFGYTERFRANVEELIGRGQGGGFFLTWERGIKLQTAATYYFQTNDGSLVLEHLAAFKDWLAEFARQRDEDPHGLLAKTRYGSDIPDPVYGIHHQAEAWRGMRDLGLALKLMGRTADAQPFLTEAAELQHAVTDAIEQSKTVLPDGSVFVPIGLLDRAAEQPYERLTDTTRGSYWNLTIHYALATGILDPGSPTATGLKEYLYRHGSLFLGLTRFNLSGADPGVCNTKHAPAWPSAPGYKSSGIDQQYGYSVMRFLTAAGEADRLDLSLYGMLAHDFSPNTFIAGEGATLSPCPQLGEYYRSQYWPPLSPNNATYLEAVRGTLIREDLDDTGMPSGLDLAPATPRPWLRDGEHIAAQALPTSFGAVGYDITSHLSKRYLTATVDPPRAEPGRATLGNITLHLRVPAGNKLVGVKVDGRSVPFDRAAETVQLGRPSSRVNVRADYVATPVRTVPHAQVTTVDTARTLVQPGEKANLGINVEVLGKGDVKGSVEVRVPSGWQTSSTSVPFTGRSDGLLNWARVPAVVTVPKQAAPGDYVIRLTARPDGGPARSTDFHVRVAKPASVSYADLVREQQPAGYWRLDETASTQPVQDASGAGNTGAFRGTVEPAAPGAIAGDPGTSVRLVDGYAEIPDSKAVSMTGPYTLEAWVKDVAAGSQGLIEKYDGGDCLPSRNGYAFRLREGNKIQAINVAEQGHDGAPSPSSVQQGRWHHVASIYDGTTLRTYLDGKLQSSTEMSQAPTDGGASLKLGARGDDGAERFEGWLDEVAVYDKALTPAQLDSHYVKGVLGNARTPATGITTVRTPEARTASAPAEQVPAFPAPAFPAPAKAPAVEALALPAPAAQPSPAEQAASRYADQVLALSPVGYWRLGEASGTSAADSSTAGNPGTYTDSVSLGRPGALTGDPDTSAGLTGGYVSVPDSAPVSVTGAFTLEAWVNLNDVCSQYSIAEKYDQPAFNGFGLRVQGGGLLSAFTLAGEGSSGSVSGQTIVTPHQWHHVVAVYDGTAISVYLDGKLDGTAVTTVNPIDGGASLKLGARGDDAGTRLAGGLDEVAVYDHALTPADIQQHYTTATTG